MEYKSSFACKKCSNPTVHDEKYDSYVCALCNSWCEDACSDENCSYCSNRPLEPFNVYEYTVFMNIYTLKGLNAMLWAVDDYLEGI